MHIKNPKLWWPNGYGEPNMYHLELAAKANNELSSSEEIDFAITTIRANVGKLRDLSPLWEMYKDGVDLSTIQWAAH